MFVVFDANLYRGMSASTLSALMVQEAAGGILAVSSFWPNLELLACLASASAREQGSALSALRRLVQHCSYGPPDEHRIRIVADEEVLLAKGLFGIALTERMEHHAAVSEFSIAIAQHGMPSANAPEYATIQNSATHVQQSEERFGRDMATAAKAVTESMAAFSLTEKAAREQLATIVKNNETLSFLARTRVQSTAERVNKKLTETDAADLATSVEKAFPIAMAVLQKLLLKAIEGGVNWGRKDRANSLWDLKLAFATSRGASINGDLVLLVTNDSLLHDAARTVGHSSFVATSEEYARMVEAREVEQRVADMRAIAA